VQVTGLNTKLTIAGQQLTADFTIDSAPGLVKIGIASVAGTSLLTLGSFVNIKAGTGALIVRAGGVAGALTVSDFAFTLPGGITLTVNTISIAVNTTPSAVKDVVVVGSTPIVLDLPAGPTVSVQVLGGKLSFGGHEIKGDFLFDQGAGKTRIAATN